MDKIISIRIPHVGEEIFENLETKDLIRFCMVSQTWKAFAEKVLLLKWKGRMSEACQDGHTKIVQLLLEHYTPEENGLNVRDEYGETPFF